MSSEYQLEGLHEIGVSVSADRVRLTKELFDAYVSPWHPALTDTFLKVICSAHAPSCTVDLTGI